MRRREFAAELERLKERHVAELVEALAEQRDRMEAEMAAELERRDAEAASVLAGVRSELADARGESIRDSFALLVRERDDALFKARRFESEFLASQETVRIAGETRERLLEERNEARRQHDEQRARADEWMAEWQKVSLERDCLAELAARAIAKVPARTTRRRYEAELAVLTADPADDEIEDDESRIEWTGPKSYVIHDGEGAA